jgi:hypothetical protein
VVSTGRDIQNARVIDAMGQPFNIPGISATPAPDLDNMRYVHELDPGGFTGVTNELRNSGVVTIFPSPQSVNLFDNNADALDDVNSNIFVKSIDIAVTGAAGIAVVLRLTRASTGVPSTFRSIVTTAANERIWLTSGFLLLTDFFLTITVVGGLAPDTIDIAAWGFKSPKGAMVPTW